MAKKRERNRAAQDATLINVRATRKRIDLLEKRIRALEERLVGSERTFEHIAVKVDHLETEVPLLKSRLEGAMALNPNFGGSPTPEPAPPFEPHAADNDGGQEAE